MDDRWRLGVVSLEPWDRIWRRNQHLLARLLELLPELTVEVVTPPADPLHSALRGWAPRTGRGTALVAGHDGRLRTHEPTKWLPGVLGGASDRILDGMIASTLRHAGIDVLWVNDPRRAGVARTLGVPTLYDITDDWTLAQRRPRERARLLSGDRWLREHADAIVVCSPALHARYGGTLVRNAVDVEAYRRPLPRPADLPERAAVYCGTLHEDRLDVALTEETGRRLARDGSVLVLVGPVALAEQLGRRLLNAPGVTVLGPRDHAEVPAYLQHADALVVPHVVDDFTDSLDPIKLYEYLAAGRPIVATACAGFADADPSDALAVVDAASFPDRASAAVASRPPAGRGADVPDWSDRARQMRDVLDDLRDRGGGTS